MNGELQLIGDVELQGGAAKLALCWAVALHCLLVLLLLRLPMAELRPPIYAAGDREAENTSDVMIEWPIQARAVQEPQTRAAKVGRMQRPHREAARASRPPVEAQAPPLQPLSILDKTPEKALLELPPAPRPHVMVGSSAEQAQAKPDAAGVPPASTDAASSGSQSVRMNSTAAQVDFSEWLKGWQKETNSAWYGALPVPARPRKAGMVVLRFKVLPNGRVMDGSVVWERQTGDAALDDAAWGALMRSSYAPLPNTFRGPYLELRAYFNYNQMGPGVKMQ